MKKITVFLLIVAACNASAQTLVSSSQLNISPLDKSPMDMVYFPANYPVLKIQDKVTEPLAARIIYSRPQKDNRLVFGDLIEYNKVWRLGANEATEIEFYKDVKIGGKKLIKGRYTLYAIPTPTLWTIIFNKDTDIWGAFKYEEKKDVLRTTVPVQKNTTPVEAFTMNFIKTVNGANLTMAWDDASVTLPIAFK